MIKRFVVAALATIVAFPAFAQSYDPSIGSGNLNSAPYQKSQPPQLSSPHETRAQIPPYTKGHRAPALRKRSQ
jgi:hypothetical protein